MSQDFMSGPSPDPVLSAPIVVRKRRRVGKKIFVIFSVLLVIVAILTLVRILTMQFPVFSQRAKVTDGWTTLRGVFNVTVGKDEAADQILSDVFKAGMDFAVLSSDGGMDLKDAAANAPLATIPVQDVLSPRGHFVTLGMKREIQDHEAEAGDTFSRLKRSGGWSVIVRALGGTDRWKAWDEMVPQGFEIMNAVQYSESAGTTALFTHFVGSVLGSPITWDYLGIRPKQALAHWDDYLRKGRVFGLCGLDSNGRYGAPWIFVVVRDGLGPYGSREVQQALLQGHFYCAIGIYGDCSGFRFMARPAGGGSTAGMMGDEVKIGQGLELWAGLNLHGDVAPGTYFVLYRDGRELVRKAGESLLYKVDEAGVYRVEVGLRVSGFLFSKEDRVFIYSNPIFVED